MLKWSEKGSGDIGGNGAVFHLHSYKNTEIEVLNK